MKDSTFTVPCPCCGARLEVDAERQVVLSHEKPRSEALPKDLQEAVAKLQDQEAERSSLFDRKMAEQKDKGDELERRFAGLLEKQKGKKPTREIREFDLD